MTRLVWFRNDLRVIDNSALYYACQDHNDRVIALFIATPKQWQQHSMSARQATFIYDNLLLLQKSLTELGIPFFYKECDDFASSLVWLDHFCHKHKITTIFYNRQYEFNELTRDQQLESHCKGKITCQSFDDSVLLPPGAVVNNNNQMYKIFTPFKKAFIPLLMKTAVNSLPAPQKRPTSTSITTHILPYFNYPHQPIASHFPPGEKAARQRLRQFCCLKVNYYDKYRDIPAIDGTSCLSPYLAIGVLSPRQCFNRLKTEHPNLLSTKNGAFAWLNELIWREFYRHLIAAYPFLCKNRPFISWTNNIKWNNNETMLSRWQQGLTGYPIVDAAMRQLNTTGWMHNRLRMISGSFLVKDLLIDWRQGEQYFMSQLIDGDFSANNGGWQWVASTGTDAVPYFRIFNPTTQGIRVDPHGDFIRCWLPELKAVPDKYIHTPHLWAIKEKQNLAYPSPIVEHAAVRKNTFSAYNQAKHSYLD